MLIEANHTAKYSKAHNGFTQYNLLLIRTALPVLKTMFKMDWSRVSVVLKPIKGRYTEGTCTYKHATNLIVIEIDCRLNTAEALLNTLAHELTHAEQYLSGRLLLDTGIFQVRGYGRRMGFHKWKPAADSSPVSFPPNAGQYSYTTYRNLPWEREAFERGEQFAKEHTGTIRWLAKEQQRKAA